MKTEEIDEPCHRVWGSPVPNEGQWPDSPEADPYDDAQRADNPWLPKRRVGWGSFSNDHSGKILIICL